MLLTTLLLIFIKIVLAAYKEAPFIEKDNAIAMGINNIIVLSWSTKIFFIAGSNNHAMAPVDPATTRDKRTESKSLLRCFLT